MSRAYYLSVTFAILLNLTLFSQPSFPPNAPVFDSSVVARVDITINPDTLQWIYENVDSDIEFHATFMFDNGTINETEENIGFRLRGNTSRQSQKKSFKISINSFESGRKFHGMEKLNLNGEHNDPSIIRSRICWDWLRQFNIAAPRSTHVQVYINGDYYGLYIMVEHIDEEFAESRFGNKDGNLYKCLYPADLKYLGSDPDLYKEDLYGRRTYALKTNKEYDNYSDLAHFIDILNNTPLDNLECEIEKVFNLNAYLKIMALDVITGNWDGYIYNKNNFYLYYNTNTDRFEYIPYDLDNTFGIDWFGRDWGTRDIYDWRQHSSEVRPLYKRLLDVPEIRDRYSFYMKQILDILADNDSLSAAIDQIRGMISSSVMNDQYYPQDYGFDYNSFMNSYNQALDGHVTYGLKPYIQTRIASASEQLVLNNIAPVISYIKSSKAIPGEEYWVRAFVEDEDPAPSVRLRYQVNGAYPEYLTMVDDGQHHDREAGDGFYGCEFPPFQINETLSWQISAIDNQSQASQLPCSPFFISFSPSSDPQLFINELMADNDYTIADEYGEYDNWAEIYNGDVEPVWLGDKYLSDNLSNPDKWQLPDLTMEPGSFLIIWCDGEPEQGSLHASYKLNDEGEELAIFDNETTGYFLIDSVSWGLQEIDISYGRQTDGNEPWILFNEPTPGYSNMAFGMPEELLPGQELHFYPNPVTNGLIHFNTPFTGELTDIMGRTVRTGKDVMVFNVSDITSGIYILRDLQGNSSKVLVQ